MFDKYDFILYIIHTFYLKTIYQMTYLSKPPEISSFFVSI